MEVKSMINELDLVVIQLILNYFFKSKCEVNYFGAFADMACVTEAWHDWLRPLLIKVVLLTTVESAEEWAACVRYAIGGKGRSGRQVPILRSCVLECLVHPLPEGAATSVMTKRLMLLQAALLELGPDQELEFQATLLTEILEYMSHPAAQVFYFLDDFICMTSNSDITAYIFDCRKHYNCSFSVLVLQSYATLESLFNHFCVPMW